MTKFFNGLKNELKFALITAICLLISSLAVSCKQNKVEKAPDVDPVQLMREYGKWICNQDTVFSKISILYFEMIHSL